MNDKWAARIWNAILIGCIVALAIAVIILAVANVESACGSPGDIPCPGNTPEPYPGPAEIENLLKFKTWLPFLSS